jgi:hypothetical protein
VLERKGAVRCGAVSLFALALSGCALSFEDDAGRRQVVGLFDMSSEVSAASDMAMDDVLHFSFYGLWLDDAFRGTSLAFGEVELSVASLRNQWQGEARADVVGSDCDGGFGFRWCSFDAPDQARAGQAFDIAVSGVSIGVGERDRHFGIGYHRQVLLEVTNENALVMWPAHVGLEGLLRGSFNG